MRIPTIVVALGLLVFTGLESQAQNKRLERAEISDFHDYSLVPSKRTGPQSGPPPWIVLEMN